MTHDKIAAFWAAMTWNALKIWHTRAQVFYREQIRRHFDRYYRLGRHRPDVIGLSNVRWSSHLVAQLREEQQDREYRALVHAVLAA